MLCTLKCTKAKLWVWRITSTTCQQKALYLKRTRLSDLTCSKLADDYGRRRFNVRISGESTCFKLNIFEFQKLMIEFPDFAELLIKMQFKQLQALLDAKV